MHFVVPVRQVPDVVEELEVAADGASLDTQWLKYRLNEFDEHALEQALLLKERYGGAVTVVAVDLGGPEESLFTALAKGADRAIKVSVDWGAGPSSRGAAAALAGVIRGLGPDLVLTGVQANDALDGQVAGLLAGALDLPCVNVVTGVAVGGGVATVRKEFAGGLVAELEVDLPAVLGIQAAEAPPRYVPVSRVRQAMKTAHLEACSAAAGAPGARIVALARPELAGRAEMLAGDAEAIAGAIVGILRERGILRG